MVRLLAALACVLAGCGVADGDPVGPGGTTSPPVGSRLTGNWILVQDSGGIALDFSGSNYAIAILATTTGSAVDGQVEKGTFSATADQVTFAPDQWTCAGSKAAYTFGYSASSGSLVLMASDGLLSFVPNTAAGGSAQLVYGCFDATGKFTPHPLGPAR